MVASCIPLMPSPEIEQIFHDELSNMAEIELADVGYIGGQITVRTRISAGCSASGGIKPPAKRVGHQNELLAALKELV